MTDATKLVAVQSEVQLMGWGDTSTRGKTVTFQLPEDSETNPFKDYAIKTKKTAGHRFYMVLVEIDDQEQPVKQEFRLSQQAAVLCKDATFWAWAAERSICTIESEEDARSWMIEGARIKSRKEFDTNRQAADWLVHTVINPYREWIAKVNAGVFA